MLNRCKVSSKGLGEDAEMMTGRLHCFYGSTQIPRCKRSDKLVKGIDVSQIIDIVKRLHSTLSLFHIYKYKSWILQPFLHHKSPSTIRKGHWLTCDMCCVRLPPIQTSRPCSLFATMKQIQYPSLDCHCILQPSLTPTHSYQLPPNPPCCRPETLQLPRGNRHQGQLCNTEHCESLIMIPSESHEAVQNDPMAEYFYGL